MQQLPALKEPNYCLGGNQKQIKHCNTANLVLWTQISRPLDFWAVCYRDHNTTSFKIHLTFLIVHLIMSRVEEG